MKRFISILLLGCFTMSVAFGALKKSQVKNKPMKHKLEPTELNYENVVHGSTPIIMPKSNSSRNSFTPALIDSSTNGYGLVSQNTRPLYVDVDNENWYTTYRQYAGELTTHGQIGSSSSEDGEDWDSYTNLNYNGNPPWGGGGVGGTGVAQGRYPSALGTPDQPLSIWNEYTTGAGAAPYGGRPYYAYDEFGWGGGSFSYPADVELVYTLDYDLWVGSPSLSYNEDDGMWVVNIVYSDWTRENRWLYHSEAYEDGFVVFDGGGGELIFDEDNDLVPGTADGSYNTSGYTSCSEDGYCGCGIVGLFKGADPENLTGDAITEYHTGIFRLSDDHGANWHGCENGGDVSTGCADDGLGYYFIPDSVFEEIVDTFDDNGSSPVEDPCDGTSYVLDDFWTGYELDFKVDSNGNPHYLLQVYACESVEGFCFNVPESGLYHFTSDRDELGQEGAWQWSKVMTAEYTWGFDDNSATSYFSNNSSSLAFSKDDPSIVYVVTGMGQPGEPDPNAPLDPSDEGYCEHIETVLDYPSWSEDIFVIKSVDGGQSWWNPLNITNTPDETGGVCPAGLGLIKCDPAETYPHAYQWATDDKVFIMYQSPNWAFNEIGDLTSADFMNRVFVGAATVNDSDIPEYGSGGGCYAEAGDINDDGLINVQDIVSLVGAVLNPGLLADECAADLNGDGFLNVQDIVGLVNKVLNPSVSFSSEDDARTASLTAGNSFIELESDGGLVQGVELTLRHGDDFKINKIDNLNYQVNEVATDGNLTKIIVVTNGLNSVDQIAEIEGDYQIVASKAVGGAGEDVLLSEAIVNDFSISSPYPNPFNPSTTVDLNLEKDAFVSINVYNVAGQLVDQLYSGSLTESSHAFTWNANFVASGIYFMSIQVDDHIETKKLMLVK